MSVSVLHIIHLNKQIAVLTVEQYGHLGFSAKTLFKKTPAIILLAVFILYLFLFAAFPLAGDLYAKENMASSSEEVPAEEFDIELALDDILGENPLIISEEESKAIRNEVFASSHEISVSLGTGVHNNVLEGSYPIFNSSTHHAAVDYLYYRNLNNTNSLLLYLLYDQSSFPDLDHDGDEKGLITLAQWNSQVTDASVVSLKLEYSYRQSFDAVNAFEDETIPLNQEEDVILTPTWEMALNQSLYSVVNLEFSAKNSQQASENYQESAITTGLKSIYGADSRLFFAYTFERKNYNDDTLDLKGNPLKGKRLQIDTHSLSLLNNHFWRGNSSLNINTNLVYSTQKDKGPGYYHYDNLYVEETLRIQLQRWNFEGRISVDQYQYRTRTNNKPKTKKEKLSNRLLTFSTSLEKYIGMGFSFFTEYTQNKYESNEADEDYISDQFMIGMEWLFKT